MPGKLPTVFCSSLILSPWWNRSFHGQPLGRRLQSIAYYAITLAVILPDQQRLSRAKKEKPRNAPAETLSDSMTGMPYLRCPLSLAGAKLSYN
jgi:hypothetical protein